MHHTIAWKYTILNPIYDCNTKHIPMSGTDPYHTRSIVTAVGSLPLPDVIGLQIRGNDQVRGRGLVV